jgi:hypothetical protein
MTAIVRPWYTWNWLTWLALVAVIGGLVARQLEKRLILGVTGLGILTEWFDFGWPLTFLHSVESGEYGVGSTFEPTAAYEWHFWRMAFNTVFSALLTASTVFVIERWSRSKQPLQFGIEGILCITAMTGGLIALSREWELPYRDFDPENATVYWSLITMNDLLHPYRWPSLVALAIALYLMASLLLRTILWRAAAWMDS